MTTMNVSLPKKLKQWAEAQVESGRYANVSDYIRDLIRREQESAKYKAWLNVEIEKGYASGFSEVDLNELFEEITGESRADLKKSA